MSRAAPALNSQLDVRPIAGSMGAEIVGVDLSNLSDGLFEQIYAAFVEHQVIFFRDQQLSPEQYLEFANRWGGIHQHPFMKHLDEYPGILEIVKTETDTAAFGNGWHSDQMFAEKPAKCTMLYAKEVPAAGGDTLFSNMYDAYDGLSPGMQQLVGGLRGWNSGDREKLRSRRSAQVRSREIMSQMTETRPAPEGGQTENAHPLVRTHKDTGRKALFIGGHTMAIDGWRTEEGQPLIDFLRTHSARPEYTCRVSWEVGTLTIWDNRCVQHYAVNDYPGQRRRMHRITIKGEEVPF